MSDLLAARGMETRCFRSLISGGSLESGKGHRPSAFAVGYARISACAIGAGYRLAPLDRYMGERGH